MISVATLLVFTLVAPAPRVAGPREIDARPRRERAAQDEDRSRGGTRRGSLELGLGVAVGLTSLALVGRGAWEIVVGKQLVKDCGNFTTNDVLCDRPDPAQGNKVAAGLSFGIAVPLAAAAAVLLVRGGRIHRDYRKFRRQQRAVALVPGGFAIRF